MSSSPPIRKPKRNSKKARKASSQKCHVSVESDDGPRTSENEIYEMNKENRSTGQPQRQTRDNTRNQKSMHSTGTPRETARTELYHDIAGNKQHFRMPGTPRESPRNGYEENFTAGIRATVIPRESARSVYPAPGNNSEVLAAIRALKEELTQEFRESRNMVFDTTRKVQQVHAYLQLQDVEEVNPKFPQKFKDAVKHEMQELISWKKFYFSNDEVFAAIKGSPAASQYQESGLEHVQSHVVILGLKILSRLRNAIRDALAKSANESLQSAQKQVKNLLRPDFMHRGLFAKLRAMNYEAMLLETRGSKESSICRNFEVFVAENFCTKTDDEKKVLVEGFLEEEEDARKKYLASPLVNKPINKRKRVNKSFDNYVDDLAALPVAGREEDIFA